MFRREMSRTQVQVLLGAILASLQCTYDICVHLEGMSRLLCRKLSLVPLEDSFVRMSLQRVWTNRPPPTPCPCTRRPSGRIGSNGAIRAMRKTKSKSPGRPKKSASPSICRNQSDLLSKPKMGSGSFPFWPVCCVGCSFCGHIRFSVN